MSYRLPDEPRPGQLAHLAVDPFWPLLAVMLGGVWLSWPWFVLNGQAVGSPTRWRELGLAAAGLLGTFALILGIGSARTAEILSASSVQYAVILLSVWKLGVSYFLYLWQARTFGIFEHFGGRPRNGMLVLVFGFIFGDRVLASLPSVWRIILG